MTELYGSDAFSPQQVAERVESVGVAKARAPLLSLFMLGLLAGAFIAEGFVSENRAGFNNLDRDYFDMVVAAYDAVVGGRRYVSSRTIASGSLLHELDIPDMVLADDNFATIVGAVGEGRRIYDNIRKAVHYLLSCNLSEVLVMLGSTLLGWPLPLLPIHILWINLVTDGFPALALAVDPKDPDVMKRPPRDPQARLLDRERFLAVCLQGTVMALVTLAVFGISLTIWHDEVPFARTMTFTTLVLVQLLHAFSCRHERYSLFQIGVMTNRALVGAVLLSALLQAWILLSAWGQEIFKVVPLRADEWWLMLGLGVLPFVVMELWKVWRRMREPVAEAR